MIHSHVQHQGFSTCANNHESSSSPASPELGKYATTLTHVKHEKLVWAGAHLKNVDEPGAEGGRDAGDVLVDEHRGAAVGPVWEGDVVLLQAQLAQRLLVIVRPPNDLRASNAGLLKPGRVRSWQRRVEVRYRQKLW